MSNNIPLELIAYVDQAKSDAEHAYSFLKETGTLSASWTFNVLHRVPDSDLLLAINFSQPWERERVTKLSVSSFAERKELILHESRLDADTFIHVHSAYLAAWSLAHQDFPSAICCRE